MAGRYPSLRLLSSLLISSIEVAFAIACLTLSASSFDINRPALPASGTGLGSSIVIATFVLCFETVVDIVVASAVGRPSAVRNSDLPVCRSYMVWKRSNCIETDAKAFLAHLIPDSLKIQNSQRWYSPRKPLAIPFLFPCRVPDQG